MIDIDIVIATYNSESTLERCLQSIRAISAEVSCNVVLIDGASNDDTLSVAQDFTDIISVVISELDSGTNEAWNKGLAYCSYPWVMFLGSDDYVCPTGFLEYLSYVKKQQGVDFVSCQVKYVDDGGRIIRVVGQPWKWRKFKKYMCALHPGSFTSLEYIRRVGKFDESLRICGDYELLLRAGGDLKTAHWPNAPICMQVGGLSDGIRVLNETLAVKLRAGYRGRIMSFVDYVIAVAKYWVRARLTRSR
jgi:glycosyltransferase involved in cell wall biosynthesis